MITVQTQTVQVVTSSGGGVTVATVPLIDVVQVGLTQDGVSHYRHVQIAASVVWTVTHALGKYPSVSIVDTAGNVVIGNVKYISLAVVECSFAAAFSGEAYCN